jgi:hypothetical protein
LEFKAIHGDYVRSVVSRQFVGERDNFLEAVEGRYESRNCKFDYSSTRSGATNRIVSN